jgi:hypothetical protein
MKKLGSAVPRFAMTLVIICAVGLSIIYAVNNPTSPSTRAFADCSCTAPDESCSASISCKTGCFHFCGNEGNCYAECADDPQADVSIELRDVTYPQLVAALTRIGRKRLEFTPTEPNALLNISFKRATLWSGLEYLSDRGILQVEGKDFESLRKLRKVLLSGERTPFTVKNTPVGKFVNDMSFVTGLPLRIVSGSPNARVNMELRNATLSEILKKAANQTGVKIKEGAT